MTSLPCEFLCFIALAFRPQKNPINVMKNDLIDIILQELNELNKGIIMMIMVAICINHRLKFWLFVLNLFHGIIVNALILLKHVTYKKHPCFLMLWNLLLSLDFKLNIDASEILSYSCNHISTIAPLLVVCILDNYDIMFIIVVYKMTPCRYFAFFPLYLDTVYYELHP